MAWALLIPNVAFRCGWIQGTHCWQVPCDAGPRGPLMGLQWQWWGCVCGASPQPCARRPNAALTALTSSNPAEPPSLCQGNQGPRNLACSRAGREPWAGSPAATLGLPLTAPTHSRVQRSLGCGSRCLRTSELGPGPREIGDVSAKAPGLPTPPVPAEWPGSEGRGSPRPLSEGVGGGPGPRAPLSRPGHPRGTGSRSWGLLPCGRFAVCPQAGPHLSELLSPQPLGPQGGHRGALKGP